MGNTSQGKTPPVDFKITTPKNPLIKNQAITKYKKSYQLPWSIPKYQPTAESSLQYPIWLDLVVAFFPVMYKPSTYDWPFTWIIVRD